ncbi:MAG: hypothetical protein GXO33_06825 [Epsilonproteobacteria bacterium]|nr:hypothetical protein [Campylobacterota bacterium]
MRLLWVVLLPILLLGATDRAEKQIYESLITLIYPQREVVKVWSDDENRRAFLAEMGPRVRLVERPQMADLVVLRHTENLQIDRPIIAERYGILKRYRERAVVGFYWKKGRPHLIFLESALRHFNIRLSDELRAYVVKRP